MKQEKASLEAETEARQEKLTKISHGLLAEKDEQEAASEMTRAFLESLESKDRAEAVAQLFGEIRELGIKTVEERVAVEEQKYQQLIKGGRQVYETEKRYIQEDPALSEKQKDKRMHQLAQAYKDSIVLEKLVKLEVVENLLRELMNPYMEDPESRTGIVYDEKEERWVSHWDPDQHHAEGTGKFLSPLSVKEIRRGLEGYYEMRGRARKVKTEAEKKLGRGIWENDRQAAQLILREILGTNEALEGGAKVLFGPITITIIFDNKKDYVRFGRGEEAEHSASSGGVHMRDILNLVSPGAFFTASTVDHENEHALNEILVKGRREYPQESAIKVVKRKYEFLRTAIDKYPSPEKALERHFQEMINEIAVATAGAALEPFANEALAYMIANKESADETFGTLTGSKLYDYLQKTTLLEGSQSLASLLGDFTDAVEGRWSVSAGRLETRQVEVRREANDFFTKRPEDKEENPRFQKNYEIFRKVFEDVIKPRLAKKEYVQMETIRQWQRGIVDSIEKLREARFSDNEIRALLAGENPVKWPVLVEKVLTVVGKKEPVGKVAFLKKMKAGVEADVDRQLRNAISRVEKMIGIFERAEKQKSFDIRQEFSEELKKGIDKELKNTLRGDKREGVKRDLESTIPMMKFMYQLHLVAPELVPRLEIEMGEEWQKRGNELKEYLQSNIRESPEEVVSMSLILKKVFPKQFSESGIKDDQKLLTDNIDFIEKESEDIVFENVPFLIQNIANFDIIFPGRLEQERPGLRDQIWEKIRDKVRKYFEDKTRNEPINFVRSYQGNVLEELANVRIAFPKGFQELHLNGLVDWDGMRKEDNRKLIEYNKIFNAAFSATILAAEKIEITDKGLKVTMSESV